MLKKIKKITSDEILEILKEYDQRVVFDKTNIIPDEKELEEKLCKYIDYQNIHTKSVLGIDIYKYSLYGEFEQSLILFILIMFPNTTLNFVLKIIYFVSYNIRSETLKIILLMPSMGVVSVSI